MTDVQFNESQPAKADLDGDVTDDTLEEMLGGEAESQTGRILVVLFQHGDDDIESSINRTCVGMLQDQIESILEDYEDVDEIEADLWVDSGGGDAHAAYKLMVLLRSFASRLRIVVPDVAKSAATLLAIGADEIYMGPAAELGPLDAQILNEDAGRRHSALDVARAVEHLGQTAITMVLTGGGSIIKATQLSRRDVLRGMLDFTAEFMKPMTSQLEPWVLHESSSFLRVAVEYANRLLVMRADDVPPAHPDLPSLFTELYPDHSFVISRDEAEGLGLPIRRLEDYDLRDRVRERHRKFRAAHHSVVAADRIQEDTANAIAEGED